MGKLKFAEKSYFEINKISWVIHIYVPEMHLRESVSEMFRIKDDPKNNS